MATSMRALGSGLVALLCFSTLSCGGGGSGAFGGSGTPPPASGSNVVSVIVDQGPTVNGQQLGSINTLFTTVTVCLPGTSTCQTIDHITVDTGSYGLRLLAPVLTLTLPVNTDGAGNSLAECVIFGIGFSWGPVASADVQISGETAKAVPVQVIGDSRFTTIPSDCTGTGGEEDTVTSFGANGILGIGPFAQDCPDCAIAVQGGTYYSCPASGACTGTTVPLANQVVNPVTLFPKDNNGVIIDLPAVANAGASTATGSLIFGIDTESNNASGTETVLTVDDNAELTMTYNSQALNQSFIDSGSNGIYFNDANIVQCTGSGYAGFYCPGNILTGLAVSIEGRNGVMANNLTFGVASAESIPAGLAAYPLLAGTNPIGSLSFDYGLAFFYGRRVAIALDGEITKAGTGPYFAF